MPKPVATTPSFERSWLRIQPDKEYTVASVNVRCEIAADAPELLWPGLCEDQVQKAISDLERLGHWRYVERIPIQYGWSPMQLDLDKMEGGNAVAEDVIRGGSGLPIYTMRETMFVSALIHFVRPLEHVNMDEAREFSEQTGPKDGMVSLDEMVRAMSERSIPDEPVPDSGSILVSGSGDGGSIS